MVGRDLKLCCFVELGSLCLYAGWGYPTVNIPVAHCMVTGSLLNKLVSEADDEWGKLWDGISEPMRVYSIADMKHRHVVWNVLVGCILRDIFLDSEAALYLTGTNQREFVAEFNTLLVEALARTEIHTDQIYPLTVFHSTAGQRSPVMGSQPRGLGLGLPSRSGQDSVRPMTGL